MKRLETVEKLRRYAKAAAAGTDDETWVDGIVDDYYRMLERCQMYEDALKRAYLAADQTEKMISGLPVSLK